MPARTAVHASVPLTSGWTSGAEGVADALGPGGALGPATGDSLPVAQPASTTMSHEVTRSRIL